MGKPGSWRLTSDYIGAGSFLLTPEYVVVGTDYGVQCRYFGDTNGAGWKVKLGSRCIGVLPDADDTIVVTCVKGLFVLSRDGTERWGTHSGKEIVHQGVPYREGVLLTSRSAIHYIREGTGSEWRFDFREILGQSVKSIRLINLFHLDDHVITAAVDYDSGIGRVVVLDKDGKKVWLSEPGPVSELFPAGNAVFVWCFTGYGKFETHMSRLDGHTIWSQDFAGVGAVRPDGALAMLVGSNESPAWDNWQYRQVAPNGKVERILPAKGRCPVRPLCRNDGSVLFLSAVLPMDPASSRVDYTNFLAMPQEVLFQHLLGIRPQLREYNVSLQAFRGEDPSELETLYHAKGSFSLCPPQAVDGAVVFGDGTDIVGLAL